MWGVCRYSRSPSCSSSLRLETDSVPSQWRRRRGRKGRISMDVRSTLQAIWKQVSTLIKTNTREKCVFISLCILIDYELILTKVPVPMTQFYSVKRRARNFILIYWFINRVGCVGVWVHCSGWNDFIDFVCDIPGWVGSIANSVMYWLYHFTQ